LKIRNPSANESKNERHSFHRDYFSHGGTEEFSAMTGLSIKFNRGKCGTRGISEKTERNKEKTNDHLQKIFLK